MIDRPPRRWELHHLTVGFGAAPVVTGIDCHLALGDLLVVTGPNGAGKSCLLRTLTGELAPLAGRVVAPPAFGIDGLGVVPQVTDLAPRLPITLHEMAALGCAGLRGAFLREQLDAALAEVGLTERAHQPWAESSGGERQRALIARALVRTPELLLLDEPTSHLDPEAAKGLFARLRARCDAGRLAVIAAIHDPTLVARHATRRLHLEAGHASVEDVA